MGMTVNEMVRRARKHAENGEVAEARQLFEEVLQKFPGNRRATEGLKMLGGGSAATSGQPGGASGHPFAGNLSRKRVEANPFGGGVRPGAPQKNNPKAQVDDLIRLLNTGQFNDVIAQGARLAKKLPKIPVIPAVMGVAYAQQQKFREAVRHYRRSLLIAPGDPNVLNNLAIAWQSLGRYDEAISACNEALARQPGFVMALLNLGNAQHAKGDHDEAIASYKKAVTASPKFAPAHHALGTALQDTGEFEEAEKAYSAAITADPAHAVSHVSYSQIHAYDTAEDPHIMHLEKLAAQPRLPGEAEECLNFALGKAWDDLGKFDKAFTHFEAGNLARKNSQPYRIEDEFQRMDRICDVFDQPPQVLMPKDEAQVSPIFVISMPRSGSTLIEQILAAHSRVAAGGEMESMRRMGETLDWSRFKPTVSALKELREEYLSLLPKVPDGVLHITDKMPANFQYLPLIFACLPEAKVVHVKRDPRASCWSMYRHRFASLGTGYTYDFEDLTRYYSRYLDFMDFCQERYADRILDLHYEALTENQEAESRRLIEFAGLEWEDACLEFHKAKSVVKTTSLQQVRRAIYKGSSETWRNYEKHLGNMLDRLKPVLERVG